MELNLPVIKLGKITLREIEKSDFNALYEVGKNKEMCTYLNWGPYKYVAEAIYAINEIYLKRPADEGLPIGYAIQMDGALRGIIDFHSYNAVSNAIEIGFFLGVDYWGRGIMTRVVKEAMKVAFQVLEVDKVVISALKENERCLHLIKKLHLNYEEEKMFEVEDGVFRFGVCYSMYKKDFRED